MTDKKGDEITNKELKNLFCFRKRLKQLQKELEIAEKETKVTVSVDSSFHAEPYNKYTANITGYTDERVSNIKDRISKLEISIFELEKYVFEMPESNEQEINKKIFFENYYLNYKSIREICREFGYSERHIYRYLHSM